MGLIVKKLPVAGSSGSVLEEVLFDSGARHSVIRTDVAAKLGHPEKLKTPQVFSVAKAGASIKASDIMLIQIKVDGHYLDGRFCVVPDLKRGIIVGADFMQNWSMALFPKSHAIKVGFDFKEGHELF